MMRAILYCLPSTMTKIILLPGETAVPQHSAWNRSLFVAYLPASPA